MERRWPRELQYPALYVGQLYQESLCDAAAVSPAGARGLAQIMPGTWADLRRRLGIAAGVSPHDPISIDAGAAYMRQRWDGWTAPRPPMRRWELALASYNAGFGNILAAQRACAGAVSWSDMAPCLPSITGQRNAHETVTYVQRTRRWSSELATVLPAPPELGGRHAPLDRCERIPPCRAH